MRRSLGLCRRVDEVRRGSPCGRGGSQCRSRHAAVAPRWPPCPGEPLARLPAPRRWPVTQGGTHDWNALRGARFVGAVLGSARGESSLPWMRVTRKVNSAIMRPLHLALVMSTACLASLPREARATDARSNDAGGHGFAGLSASPAAIGLIPSEGGGLHVGLALEPRLRVGYAMTNGVHLYGALGYSGLAYLCSRRRRRRDRGTSSKRRFCSLYRVGPVAATEALGPVGRRSKVYRRVRSDHCLTPPIS